MEEDWYFFVCLFVIREWNEWPRPKPKRFIRCLVVGKWSLWHGSIQRWYFIEWLNNDDTWMSGGCVQHRYTINSLQEYWLHGYVFRSRSPSNTYKHVHCVSPPKRTHSHLFQCVYRSCLAALTGTNGLCFHNKTQTFTTKKCKWNILMMSSPRVF